MINSNYTKPIPVVYKFKEFKRETTIEKGDSLKFLKEKIENESQTSLAKMKLIYNGSNILLNNQNYKIFDFLGDLKLLNLQIEPQEFTEESYIAEFEEKFKNGLSIEKDQTITKERIKSKDEKLQKNKHLKNIIPEKTYTTTTKERDICNKDQTNEANYICMICRLLWCKHCIKYEVHKSDLVELNFVDTYLNMKRTNLSKDIEENVCADEYYDHLQKVDYVLNDKIGVIENQFKTILNLINSIKESQIKSLIDTYYQKVDNKTFKNISTDIKYFKNKVLEINNTYDKKNREDNINDSEVLEKFRDVIKQNFNDFKLKYRQYFKYFDLYNHFNSTFISQLEAKYKASNDLRSQIIKDESQQSNTEEIQTPVEKQIKFPSLYKMKYYNSILQWDHTKGVTNRIKDFDDKFEFKLNYQVYSGNIFLNHFNRLFIVTGTGFNLFYFYDPDTNQMMRLKDLNDNHCRGSLNYIKKLNGFLCLSGKYTNKCEFLNCPYDYIQEVLKDDKKITNKSWEEFPSLNYQRQASALSIFNENFLFCFFGYNSLRGNIDLIEKINLNELNSGWSIVSYTNPKFVDLRISSHGLVYANRDELYIVGGCISDKFTDKIFKYNLVNNAIYPTDLIIPGIKEAEYFRFWEESEFKSLSSFGSVFNSDDEYTFGMYDAKDKLHLFNARTFKYTIG